MLADGLLLDLDLREECVLLLLVHSIFVHVHVILSVIVELANSPIGSIVIGHFLRWHHLSTTSAEPLGIEDLVCHTALRMHHLGRILLVLGRRDKTSAKRVHL